MTTAISNLPRWFEGEELIDAHLHLGRWAHADFLGRDQGFPEAVQLYESIGFSGMAICPADTCEHDLLLGQMKAYAGRGGKLSCWWLPWIHPISTPQGQADLAWINEHRDSISGLKIHPSLSRLRIGDPELAPFLDFAEKQNWIVLIHCGRWQEMASYRFCVEEAKRRPNLRFLLAHAGGDTPPLATGAADMVKELRVSNVWFEFSGLREFWVIERNVRVLGAERYLMGSDFNLAHPLMYVGAVAGMSLSLAEKRRILGLNAKECFGRPVGKG